MLKDDSDMYKNACSEWGGLVNTQLKYMIKVKGGTAVNTEYRSLESGWAASRKNRSCKVFVIVIPKEGLASTRPASAFHRGRTDATDGKGWSFL